MAAENDVTDRLVSELEATWPEESAIADQFVGNGDAISDGDDAANSQPQPASNPAPHVSGFDPVIHATGPDGKPVFNQDGSLRKKRGRKPGSVATVGSVVNTAGNDAELAKARTVAIAAVETLIMAGKTIGGDEWEPASEPINERENLYSAYTAYFLTRPDIDIPPWMGLVMATGMYALPRLSRPVTSSKLERITSWIKVKLFDRIWSRKWRKSQSLSTGNGFQEN